MNRAILSSCHIQYLILHEISCIFRRSANEDRGESRKTRRCLFRSAFNIGGIWAVLLSEFCCFCLRPHTAVQSLHHSSGAEPENRQLETLSELHSSCGQLYRDSHDSILIKASLAVALSASLSLTHAFLWTKPNINLCVRRSCFIRRWGGSKISAFLLWNLNDNRANMNKRKQHSPPTLLY